MRTTLLLAAVFPLLLQAQNISEKAGELMSAYSNQQKFSGSVLIAVKNKIVFNKAYGYANLETKQPNTTETAYRAGSLTKMFTAVLVLQLVNENKLQLNDPISKYVQGIDASGKVTIRHLLSHTSGLKGTTAPTASSLEEIVHTYKAGRQGFEPGTAFEYNNFNFMLLSYISQKVTGVQYSSLVKNKVLQKAGMLHSGIDYNKRISSAKASGYVTDPATNKWVLTGTDGSVAAASGAGALFTTTGDLFKWALAIGSPKLLPKKLWEKLFTPVQPGYGFGMMLNNEQGRYKTGHTGSIPGFIADFAHFPKDSITIIYLSNYQDVDGRKLEKNLTALVYNEPYEMPVQKKEITLSKEVLEEYTGIYELQENVQIKVELQDTVLVATAPGGDKVELTPEAKDKFFLKGPEISVQFRRDNDKITAMYIDMQGGQLFKRK
jgi:CubicO group peptidase (beta-lactamase class C family)